MNGIFLLKSLNMRHHSLDMGVDGRIIHTYIVHVLLSHYRVVLKT